MNFIYFGPVEGVQPNLKDTVTVGSQVTDAQFDDQIEEWRWRAGKRIIFHLPVDHRRQTIIRTFIEDHVGEVILYSPTIVTDVLPELAALLTVHVAPDLAVDALSLREALGKRLKLEAVVNPLCLWSALRGKPVTKADTLYSRLLQIETGGA